MNGVAKVSGARGIDNLAAALHPQALLLLHPPEKAGEIINQLFSSDMARISLQGGNMAESAPTPNAIFVTFAEILELIGAQYTVNCWCKICRP